MKSSEEEPAQEKLTRRRFIGRCIQAGGSVSVIGLLLGAYNESAKSMPAWAIHPPGAIDEDNFLSACVRCGLCVRACPFDTLRLAELGEAVATGSPYFVARQVPCEMCEDIPCAAACPTDALGKTLLDIREADMGLAVFTGVSTCYSTTGIAHCRACYLACPVAGDAITMEKTVRDGRLYFEPTVHPQSCTGCGKCEHACVTNEASIKVFPRQLATQDRTGP